MRELFDNALCHTFANLKTMKAIHFAKGHKQVLALFMSFSNSMAVVLIVWMKVEADARLRCFYFRFLMGLESVTVSLNELRKTKY